MTAPAPTEKPERMTVYVPKSLRRAIRIAAATEDASITDWVVRNLAKALPTYSPAAPE